MRLGDNETPALSFLSQGCNLSWPWPSSRRVPRISCSILQLLAVGSKSKTRLLCHSWIQELLTCSFKYTGSFGPFVFCLFPCGTLKKPCSLSAELLTPESYLCLSLVLFNREPFPSNSQTLVAPSGGQTSFPDPFGGVYCPQLAQKVQSLSAMWVAFQITAWMYFFMKDLQSCEMQFPFSGHLLNAQEKRSLISCVVALRQARGRENKFSLDLPCFARMDWFPYILWRCPVSFFSFHFLRNHYKLEKFMFCVSIYCSYFFAKYKSFPTWSRGGHFTVAPGSFRHDPSHLWEASLLTDVTN